MLYKDHEQKSSWSSRRAQRCLSFAVIFIIIFIFGLSSPSTWPKKAELGLDTTRDYVDYAYGSSPEAGRPSLPFVDNSIRKATENPFFDVPYHDDEEYLNDEAVNQQIIEPRDEPEEELTREQLESKEGKLIGLN